jgi:hypothetical protein
MSKGTGSMQGGGIRSGADVRHELEKDGAGMTTILRANDSTFLRTGNRHEVRTASRRG